MRGYQIDFTEPPPVGTVIAYRGLEAELIEVRPYMRKTDGAPSFLLVWRIGDRTATSGLRCNSVMWARSGHEDA